MMFGLEMESHYAPLIADRALDEGLIINCTAKNVLRIMPALNLSHADCSRGIKILENIFRDVC
jgi:acetylornithine/succinyldiaminopimelate/putrescine aminotransferase